MITNTFLSSKTLTAAVMATVMAGQAITFASAASAHDRLNDRYNGGPYESLGYGRDHRNDGPRENRDYGRREYRDYGRGNFDHRPQYVERRKKDKTGRNIAIGIGAFMLGAILASEASRH